MGTGHGSPARGRTGKRITDHGSRVPWSASGELWTRRALVFDTIACISSGIGAVACLAFLVFDSDKRFSLVGGILGAAAIFWLYMAARDAMKLNAMLLNRPYNAAGMTTWVQLRAWQTEICCACGTIVIIDGAPWFPNSVDAGGGRYSIVCPCGIGYYKLREEKAVTRAS
jgi:hypothetical protein